MDLRGPLAGSLGKAYYCYRLKLKISGKKLPWPVVAIYFNLLTVRKLFQAAVISSCCD